MKAKKIYFDMDGVLADFNRGVEELCGIPMLPYDEVTEEWDNEMWRAIRQVGHFYDKLEPLPGALEMFETIYKKYGDCCEILTGIPKAKRGILTAGEDKTAWAHRLLMPELVVNIVYAEDKKDFCKGEEYVLIDDLQKNIDAWESSGGTGILFRSPEQALELLRGKNIL